MSTSPTPEPVGPSPGRKDGRFRRVLHRLASSQEEIEARELQRDVQSTGCTRIQDAVDRERVMVRGTLRHVTLRPRSGTPALEAELYDGSGSLTVVWLGRRRIAGIEPGVALRVQGRVSTQDGVRVIYNPRYELSAGPERHA
jgi:RecG-like helicase